jgi:CBS domain-containing protein
MSSPLVTISESATVEEAMRLMTQKKVKTLPVMYNEACWRFNIHGYRF